MLAGDKPKYSDKQERQAGYIEDMNSTAAQERCRAVGLGHGE